jgi:hypothetical protein
MKKVLVVIVGALVFFVAIRILFNPRPVVYVLSFPYGFLAGSAASVRLWLRLRRGLHLEKRTPLPAQTR